MLRDKNPSPGFRTFTLRWLLTAVGILALPMALMHYYVHGPAWFRAIVALGVYLGSLVFVLCAPTLALLAIELCQGRSRAAAMIVVFVAILIALSALATILLFETANLDRDRKRSLHV